MVNNKTKKYILTHNSFLPYSFFFLRNLTPKTKKTKNKKKIIFRTSFFKAKDN